MYCQQRMVFKPFFFFASILILLKFCKLIGKKKLILIGFTDSYSHIFSIYVRSPFFFIFYIFRHANLLLPLNITLQFHLYSIWRLHRIHQISNFKHPFEWIIQFIYAFFVCFFFWKCNHDMLDESVVYTMRRVLWEYKWINIMLHTKEWHWETFTERQAETSPSNASYPIKRSVAVPWVPHLVCI